MSSARTWASLLAFFALAAPAFCAESGLNTIPTTDTVHVHRIVIELENDNTSFITPTLTKAPHLTYGSELGLTRRVEAGVDLVQPDSEDTDDPAYQASFSIKYKVKFEDPIFPNFAVGIHNVGTRQKAGYYVAFSKTLNYAAVQGQKAAEDKAAAAAIAPAVDNAPDTPTTHHHAQDVFGQRLHVGLLFQGPHTYQPFVGYDQEVNSQVVVQADWISGTGGALSLGGEYTFPNHRTAINPAFLMSNQGRRVDGFFLNISTEFKLLSR